MFFIVVVIPGHNMGNSQVSVNRTIGPTLVSNIAKPRERSRKCIRIPRMSGDHHCDLLANYRSDINILLI